MLNANEINSIKITWFKIVRLFNKAYPESSLNKGTFGFKTTGIFPKDPFLHKDFIAIDKKEHDNITTPSTTNDPNYGVPSEQQLQLLQNQWRPLKSNCPLPYHNILATKHHKVWS